MSEPRKIPSAQASSTPSRNATVVRVIRGSSETPSPPAAKKSAYGSKPKAKRKPESELEPIHKVVNQRNHTKYRDFTLHNSRPEADLPEGIRMARGPYFPLATSLRFAALFYILGRLSIVATVVSLVWLTLTEGKDYLIVAPSLIAAIFFTFIAWGMSNGLRCRVCTMPFLSKRRCKMNKKAPKLPFVSHHFTVALHILTHNHPRCPYCGTTNRLKQ